LFGGRKNVGRRKEAVGLAKAQKVEDLLHGGIGQDNVLLGHAGEKPQDTALHMQPGVGIQPVPRPTLQGMGDAG